jgi:hypothetical protein
MIMKEPILDIVKNTKDWEKICMDTVKICTWLKGVQKEKVGNDQMTVTLCS